MKERIEKLIEKLQKERANALTSYLAMLENTEVKGFSNDSQQRIEVAGVIQDLDRHLTILAMELKLQEIK
jgi:CHAD domain-containing protein